VNQELINWFEPATPPVAARLDALSMLADSGIRTYAFLGPLLPFLSDSEEDIGRLVAEVARRGVSSLIADSMNLRGVAVQRMCRILCGRRPDLVVRYRAMSQGRTAYHRSLREVVRAQAARYRLEVVM
jgi:DNA repair photolyase